MLKISKYMLLVLLTSCGQIAKNTDTPDSTKTTALANKNQPVADNTLVASETEDHPEEDCVFNSDYKKLTTDWLSELNIKDFIWRVDLGQALIPRGQDTIFLSEGGCTHFDISVEIKIANETHPLTDSTFWIRKSLDLAKEFGMTHFEKMINEGKIRKAKDQNGETRVWYEIEDDDTDDNLIYNGIEIISTGHVKKLNMTQYFN